MMPGGRGAAALAWGSASPAGQTCALGAAMPATITHVADRELEQLLELMQLLDRGSSEAQRLAAALRRSRAAARLFASDVAGFRAALAIVARQLWPEGDAPFGVVWALQAVGVELEGDLPVVEPELLTA